MQPREWYEDHDNIAMVADHMARTGSSADEVAHFVGKPWHYADAYKAACTEQFEADNAMKIAAEQVA